MLPQPALSLTLSLRTALPVSHQGDNTSHRLRYQHGLCTVSVSRTLGTRTMTRGNHTCHCCAGSFPRYQRQHWSSPSQHRPGMHHGLCVCVVGYRWFRTPTCIAWATTLFSGTHAGVAERASVVATTAAAAGASVPAPRKLSMAEKLKLKMRALMKNTVGT